MSSWEFGFVFMRIFCKLLVVQFIPFFLFFMTSAIISLTIWGESLVLFLISLSVNRFKTSISLKSLFKLHTFLYKLLEFNTFSNSTIGIFLIKFNCCCGFCCFVFNILIICSLFEKLFIFPINCLRKIEIIGICSFFLPKPPL